MCSALYTVCGYMEGVAQDAYMYTEHMHACTQLNSSSGADVSDKCSLLVHSNFESVHECHYIIDCLIMNLRQTMMMQVWLMLNIA